MAGGVSSHHTHHGGMVGAISGIFAFNYLKSTIDRDLEFLEDHLPINQ